jgi:threonine synthase
MKYISTRGGIPAISFKEAVLMGLATDGGLLLPERLPVVSAEESNSWKGLSYQDLACKVLSLFITDIPSGDLKELIDRSYATFNHPEVTPVVKKGKIHILELFHGVSW